MKGFLIFDCLFLLVLYEKIRGNKQSKIKSPFIKMHFFDCLFPPYFVCFSSETLLGKLRVLLRTFDAANKQKDKQIEQRENGNVANGFVAESEWTTRWGDQKGRIEK